jgi:serine protease
VLPGYDFVSEAEYANDGDGRDNDPSDPGDWVSPEDLASPVFEGCISEASSWHGTIIAGQIAAATDNGLGVASVNWNGQVLPVRVAGKCGAAVTDIIDGIRWAAGLQVADGQGGFVPVNPNPARIINISFGGSAPCDAPYQDAINEVFTERGAIVVAAAGNEHGAPTRPASCEHVIGVAALNRDGFKSSYSNFGPTLKIATVGGDPGSLGAWGSIVGDSGLLTIINRGVTEPEAPDFEYLSGTSFAAPLVSGIASLMLSVNPGLAAADMVRGLQESARPHVTSPSIAACSDSNPGRCACTTTTCGAGIADAERAVMFAQGLPLPPLPVVVIANQDVREAAAAGPDLPPNPGAGPGPAPIPVDDGGGALDLGWLVALALAVTLLARVRRG